MPRLEQEAVEQTRFSHAVGVGSLDWLALRTFNLMKNPPAFPYAFQHEDGTRFIAEGFSPGMTLRDYFAARASERDIQEYATFYAPPEHLPIRRSREQAKYAYADAMIDARELAKVKDEPRP